MANVTDHLVQVNNEISQWMKNFHEQLGTDAYESGHPDKRGLTDQLVLSLKCAIPLDSKFEWRFANQLEESEEGYDFTVSFSHLEDGSSNSKRFMFFFQGKMILGKGQNSFNVEFSEGRDEGLLQAEKLHRKICFAIDTNPYPEELHIKGGYLIYGPPPLGIIYLPIKYVKDLWTKHYNEDLSNRVLDQAMTKELLEVHQNSGLQFEKVVADPTEVPPMTAWLSPSESNEAMNSSSE